MANVVDPETNTHAVSWLVEWYARQTQMSILARETQAVNIWNFLGKLKNNILNWKLLSFDHLIWIFVLETFNIRFKKIPFRLFILIVSPLIKFKKSKLPSTSDWNNCRVGYQIQIKLICRLTKDRDRHNTKIPWR